MTSSVSGGVAKIVDPLLAIMEMLTLIAAPLMFVMMAAIHRACVLGNMRLQLVGVFAYGGVHPVIGLIQTDVLIDEGIGDVQQLVL